MTNKKKKECEECDQRVKVWTHLKNQLGRSMNTGCKFGLFDWFGNEKLGMFHDVMIVSTNLMCGLYEAAQRSET